MMNTDLDKRETMLCKTLLIVLQAISGAVAATSWIAPGAIWYDTDGKKIDAHGGSVVKRGDTFYWVGQSASNSEPSSFSYMFAVPKQFSRILTFQIDQTPMMYSSTDLLNWKNLGQQAPGVTGLWRPKIAKPNGSFWVSS